MTDQKQPASREELAEDYVEREFSEDDAQTRGVAYVGFIAGYRSATAQSAERIRELETRIEFILDDPECELYRNQAAEAVGYKGSFPGKRAPEESSKVGEK